MKHILSIQSEVAYGHVGNTAAVFPLQRLGHEVYQVHTVLFAAHTGYGVPRGLVVPTEKISDVIVGVEERGVFPKIDAVLSGYQGSVDVGNTIVEAAKKVKAANPNAIFFADPVFGDYDKGIYVPEGVPQFLKDNVVSQADVLVPNLFEMSFLVGRESKTSADVIENARQLISQGPKLVLVTSAITGEVSSNAMRMMLVTADDAWVVETPILDRSFTGSGDFTSAMFLSSLLSGLSYEDSLSNTASVVYSVLKYTTDQKSDELMVIETQEEFASPTYRFSATKL